MGRLELMDATWHCSAQRCNSTSLLHRPVQTDWRRDGGAVHGARKAASSAAFNLAGAPLLLRRGCAHIVEEAGWAREYWALDARKEGARLLCIICILARGSPAGSAPPVPHQCVCLIQLPKPHKAAASRSSALMRRRACGRGGQVVEPVWPAAARAPSAHPQLPLLAVPACTAASGWRLTSHRSMLALPAKPAASAASAAAAAARAVMPLPRSARCMHPRMSRARRQGAWHAASQRRASRCAGCSAEGGGRRAAPDQT